MSSKNTAAIISKSNDFFKKYEKQLKSCFNEINQIQLSNDLKNSLAVNVNDCYFLDNTNNNFSKCFKDEKKALKYWNLLTTPALMAQFGSKKYKLKNL